MGAIRHILSPFCFFPTLENLIKLNSRTQPKDIIAMEIIELRLTQWIKATKEAIENGTVCKYNPILFEQKEKIIYELGKLNHEKDCGLSENDIVTMVNNAFVNYLGIK